MKCRQYFFFVLTFLSGTAAYGGAWGVGSFENDDALDWVYELEESSGFSALSAALRPVATDKGYIDAPSGSYAIAAAEALAALIGEAPDGLPEEVLDWVKRQDQRPSGELLAEARKALKVVLDENRSELAQLWGDDSHYYKMWRTHLESLSERLK